jgi:anion-transporting  ArsA/GET3 family ATPase
VTGVPGADSDHRVVVCVGVGGVGKTTTAAALGVAAAEAGRRVVVVTIDPARRLADALGLRGSGRGLGRDKGLGDEPRPVEGVGPGTLWGVMLDPQATFDRLIREQAGSDEQARRILSNPIYTNLTQSLSGTHEYLAAEKLYELHHDERFDLVVVDTPPARHALDVLDGPNRLMRFLDHRLYRSVLGPRQGVLRAVNTATRSVLRTLGRLVGAELVDDVIAFFAAFEGIDEEFRRRADAVNRLLVGPETAFVLVTSPRHEALHESRWMLGQLDRRAVDVAAVVVNRATPDLGPPPGADALPPGLEGPLAAWTALQAMASAERAAIADLVEQWAGIEVHVVDERERPVADLAGLGILARHLRGDPPAGR